MEKFERLLECCTRPAVIYTTRLEDMAILGKKTINQTFKKLIEDIIAKSKPRFVPSQERAYKSTIAKSKRNCFRKFKLKRSRKNRNRCVIFSSSELQDHKKLNSSNSELSIGVDQADVINITENDIIDSTNGNKSIIGSSSKSKDYQAMTVEVKNIGKNVPKKISDERELEVVTISSDDENPVTALPVDDVTIPTETSDNVTIPTKTSEDVTENSNVITITVETVPDERNYTIKSLDDFACIIREEKFRNSLFVIYNEYSRDIDAYVISGDYTLKKTFRMVYTQIMKLQIKNCRSIFNLFCCCWFKRRCYLQLLSAYIKCASRLMLRHHSCKPKQCKCCCKNDEDTISSYKCYIKKQESRLLKRQCQSKKDKLISAALNCYMQPTKHTKWKSILKTDNKVSLKNHKCRELFKLCEDNGFDEMFELGPGDVVYSKIVNSNRPDSSWLSKTYKKNEIVTYPHSLFLHTHDSFRTIKSSFIPCLSNLNAPKVVGYANFYKLLIPQTPKKMGKKSSASTLQDKRMSNILSKKVDNIAQETLNPDINVTEDGQSAVVRSLISDILQRFSNVRLTINAEGQVAATLNAPTSSLSSSELTILSEILKYAQNQVDKISTKPETSFNSDGLLQNSSHGAAIPAPLPILNPSPPSNDSNRNNVLPAALHPKIISNVSNNSNADSVKINMENVIQEERNIQAPQGVKQPMINNMLTTFSSLMRIKKRDYENSFRKYIKKTTDFTPNIISVLSINEDQASQTVISENSSNQNIYNQAIEKTNNQQKNSEKSIENQDSTSRKGKKRKKSFDSDNEDVIVTKVIDSGEKNDEVFEEALIVNPNYTKVTPSLEKRDPLETDLIGSSCDYVIFEES